MTRKVIAEFDAIDGPFINKLNAIDRSVARFETGTLNAFGRVEKGVSGLLSSAGRLQNVSGIIAGGFGAGIAAQYIDQATRIRRALSEVGGEGQQSFNEVFLASQRSLAGFDAFAQGVARMQKSTGGTFSDAVRNMETLNKLLVLGGKTTQERQSTTTQFSQALQSGTLAGEELRSLRENAPIELLRAIAEEAGGTIESLKDLGSEGKLNTEVMIRALQRLEAEADARMKNVTLTISEAATVLGNAGIVAVEGFDKGLGLSRAAVGGLTGLAKVLGESAEAAEMFGKALQIAAGAGLAAYAGGKVSAATESIRKTGIALRSEAEAARVAAIASRQSANAAVDVRNKKLNAFRDLQRSQDTYITSVRSTALAEANLATASRGAAQDKVAQSRIVIAAANAELAATNKLIAGEARRRSLGIMGGSRRDLYGDLSDVRQQPGLTEAAFQAQVAKRTQIEAQLKALDAQRIASEKLVTAAIASETATRGKLSVAGLQAATDFAQKNDRRRAVLLGQLAAAEAKVTTTQAAQVLSSNALATAQGRVAFAARASAFAMNSLNSAVAFLGGPLGIILAVGTAFLLLRQNVESAADRFTRLTTDTGSASSAADALLDVQTRLNEAIAASGGASDDASRRIIANTQAELLAKAQLLQLERDAAILLQAERQVAIADTQNLIREKQAEIDLAKMSADKYEGLFGSEGADGAALAMMREGIVALQVEQDKLNAEAISLNANYVLVGGTIDAMGASLASAYGNALFQGEGLVSQAFDLAAGLFQAEGAASGIAGTNMAGAIDPAASAAERLVSYLASAWSWVRSLVGLAPSGVAVAAATGAPAFEGRGRMGSATGPAAPPPLPSFDELVERNTIGGGGGGGGGGRRSGGGGGGGSGGGAQRDLQREALQFIESMMTAEERHAQKVKELTDMRGLLVAKYGEEAEIVARLDEATSRLGETGENAFAGMLSKISQMVLEGKDLDEILSSILVQFLEMNGTEAFAGLFGGGGFGGFIKTLFKAPAATGGVSLAASAPAAAQKGLQLPDARRMAARNDQQGKALNVTIHENAVSGPPEVKHDPVSGRLDVFLRKQVVGVGDSGGLDGMMSRRYGLKPVAK